MDLPSGDLLPPEVLHKYGSFVGHNNYDALAVAVSFIDFAATNHDGNFGTAWDAWKPDHQAILAQYRGSNCVGLALGSLPLFEPYGGTLMKSTKNGHGHFAVRVPFKSEEHVEDAGVVIIDPGLNFRQPVIVRNKSVTNYFERHRGNLIGYEDAFDPRSQSCRLVWPARAANKLASLPPQDPTHPVPRIINFSHERQGDQLAKVNTRPRLFFDEAVTVDDESIVTIGKSTVPFLKYGIHHREAGVPTAQLVYHVVPNQLYYDAPGNERAFDLNQPLDSDTKDDITDVGIMLESPFLLERIESVLLHRQKLLDQFSSSTKETSSSSSSSTH